MDRAITQVADIKATRTTAHRGTCRFQYPNNHSCLCSYGYSGIYCDIKIDDDDYYLPLWAVVLVALMSATCVIALSILFYKRYKHAQYTYKRVNTYA